ncbi:hypothetical protein, partial [Dickeya dianthicola]
MTQSEMVILLMPCDEKRGEVEIKRRYCGEKEKKHRTAFNIPKERTRTGRKTTTPGHRQRRL